MTTPEELKLRNHIVKYSVGTLFKIYTHPDNEEKIMKEMLILAKSKNYILPLSTNLSTVPPPLVHYLLVKTIDKLKNENQITIP